MCAGCCWQQPCGSPGPVCPVLRAVQTRAQGWSSPHSANEDDLYKIHINAEKHWGFDFASFILPLDHFVYEATGDAEPCFAPCTSICALTIAPPARLAMPTRAADTFALICHRLAASAAFPGRSPAPKC